MLASGLEDVAMTCPALGISDQYEPLAGAVGTSRPPLANVAFSKHFLQIFGGLATESFLVSRKHFGGSAKFVFGCISLRLRSALHRLMGCYE